MICMLELIWARARLVLCSASLLAGSPATNLYSTVQYNAVQCRHPPVLLAHVLGRQPAHPLQSLHILLDQLTATIIIL